MTLINQLDEKKAIKLLIMPKVELITKEILDKRRSIVAEKHLVRFFLALKVFKLFVKKF